MRPCAAAALLAAGCFRPHPEVGSLCSPEGVCPDGLICSMGKCVLAPFDDAAPDDTLADTAGFDAPPGAPILVQQVTAHLDHAATLSATLPAAPQAGHVLLMIGANEHDVLTSVTGGGTTWTMAAGSQVNANEEVWFGITDGTSATVTINCATNCGAQPTWMNLSEWSGLAT